MISPGTTEAVAAKYGVLQKEFNERGRRIWAAAEATSLGHGGVITVARATGLAESTIRIGRREIKDGSRDHDVNAPRNIRRKGGGRKTVTNKDSSIVKALEALVDPASRGDPMSPLLWTCKSTRQLSGELLAAGHSIIL